MKNKNPVWALFSSVKLALTTLCLLAVTSIIGTIIPQKESLSFYAGKYGPKWAQLFDVLDIPDMYNSWWFLGLLGLLSANLIICSIDRFPGVWKQITADNFAMPIKRLQKMARRASWQKEQNVAETVEELSQSLAANGWKTEQQQKDGGSLLFAQKAAWSRTGVYFVHLSILIIFVGAIVGEIFGFKAGAMITETKQIAAVRTFDTQETIDLGFSLRCDSFTIEFYPNSGMPKDYRSVLTVLENGKEILTTPIEVNAPLKYKGITFYQSSYQGYQDFLLTLKNNQTGVEKTFVLPFQQQTNWTEEGVRFGVINAEAAGQSITRMKIWFTDDKGEPSIFWLDPNNKATIQRNDGDYTLFGKQLYATGLQISKDPGVWIVYIGCGIMLLGLSIAFFISHRRIWLFIREENGITEVLFAGSANKNRVGFQKTFDFLTEKLKVA